ncbi:MAG: hypothetical protein QOG59_2745 [Solirubrobacteraceae bacterium]|jgi:hypothetical protein|nr:hypothetical protein [Solirubrobacteraceae bacterium]
MRTDRHAGLLTLSLVFIFGFGALGSAQAQPLPSAAWSVVPSPKASAGNNLLNSVASVSAGDVWSVGSADDANGNSHPLREHWNGTAWTIVPGPTGFGVLKGVAAASSDAVWAVGQDFGGGMIEHWNGTAWSDVPNPGAGPGTTLNGVAAVSSKDVWTVGEATATGTARTLIEHFDGNAWTVVPSPNASDRNNLLIAITAVSASDVWAVGDFQNGQNVFRTLIEHWDGTAWHIVPSPNGAGVQAGLLSVTALSATNVWAAGDTGASTLVEHWNGTSWTVVPSPTPTGTQFNPLFGLAAVSERNIWAVGQTQNATTGSPTTLIEHWNGTTWTITPSPNPGSQATLTAAAADRSTGQTWAVGNFTEPFTGTQHPLTEFNP